MHTSPAKNRLASVREGASSMPGATRRSATSPHRPAMANGRLLSTSSAQGMPQSARWSANVCWCALAGVHGLEQRQRQQRGHAEQTGFSA